MIRPLRLSLLSIALAGAGQAQALAEEDAPTPSACTLRLADHSIVPGHRLGPVELRQTLDSVNARLGPSPDQDAAMGKVTESWSLKGGARLKVFATRPDEHTMRILEIRTTSRAISTSDGLKVGSTLEKIRQVLGFGTLVPLPVPTDTQTYVPRTLSHREESFPCYLVYPAKGIAFELNGREERSTAGSVIIFPAGS